MRRVLGFGINMTLFFIGYILIAIWLGGKLLGGVK